MLIKGDTRSLDYNPYSPLCNPSFHFISHFGSYLPIDLRFPSRVRDELLFNTDSWGVLGRSREADIGFRV